MFIRKSTWQAAQAQIKALGEALAEESRELHATREGWEETRQLADDLEKALSNSRSNELTLLRRADESQKVAQRQLAEIERLKVDVEGAKSTFLEMSEGYSARIQEMESAVTEAEQVKADASTRLQQIQDLQKENSELRAELAKSGRRRNSKGQFVKA